MEQSLFLTIAIIVIIATIVSIIFHALRQPLLVGYIVTGVIVSPTILHIIPSANILDSFTHIGIAILLFMVGLNLDPKVIKDVGKISVITGLGQVIFTSFFGYFIGILLGFNSTEAIYLAIALTFSSTIIITKLLSDKRDLDTLYGKISIGFLIVQDLVVIFVLLFISSASSSFTEQLQIVPIMIGFLITLFVFSKYALPPITRKIASSQELLLLFSLGWCFAITYLGYTFNLTLEAGALLAGISLAMSPYRFEIGTKVKPIRDFFLILFFIALGSQINFESVQEYLIPIIIFSFFILIGNPLIVMILMGIQGYTKKNGFFCGLTVAQISEFSIIFIALGVSVGHIPEHLISIVTIIGLITISASTYLIYKNQSIYSKIHTLLTIFEIKKTKHQSESKNESYQVIILGFNRTGSNIISSVLKMKKKCLVIDYDPGRIEILQKDKIPHLYGDATDYELLQSILTKKTKIIISTIPDFYSNAEIVRRLPKNMISIFVSDDANHALKLYELGATYVILPHFLGGSHTSVLIEKHKFDIKKFLKHKNTHVKQIKTHIEKNHHKL